MINNHLETIFQKCILTVFNRRESWSCCTPYSVCLLSFFFSLVIKDLMYLRTCVLYAVQFQRCVQCRYTLIYGSSREPCTVQYSWCITMIWWAVRAYDDKETWSLRAQSLGQSATMVGRFIDQIERRRHFLLTTKSESIRIKSLNWFTNHYPNIFYWRKLFGEKWGCHECLTRNLWGGWIKHSAHSTEQPLQPSS